MKTNLLVKAGILAIALGIMYAPSALTQSGALRYEADAAWPKPLPDRWVLGGLGGVCVDNQDHVFILNRQDVVEGDLNGGKLAPPIIEFDPAGNVVNSWGDLKVLDPRLHSCRADKDNNMWVASAPSGMVQKFSHDGSKMLLQIGKKGVAIFFMPSSIFIDPQNGDVYVSDGEGRDSNRRIAVLDRTGKFLRQWQPEGMTTVHCMSIANDGQVYVCNRDGSRIQVYDKMGNFKKNIEVPWTPVTPPHDGKLVQSGGSAVAFDFSHDPNQKFIFLINQNNAQVEIIDRQSGKIVSSFGRPGSFPGQFNQAHGIAVDSKDNVYIAENRGKRIQKFKLAGR